MIAGMDISATGSGGEDPWMRIERWFGDCAERLKATAIRDFRCSPAEAEELVQEVFVKALEATAKGSPPRKDAWFYTTMRNYWLNHIRSARIRLTGSLELLLAAGVPLSADDPTPAEALIKVEQLEALQACLRALPEQYRKVIELTDLCGLTAEEAKEILGMAGAIFGLQHRARQALRKCMANKGFEVTHKRL